MDIGQVSRSGELGFIGAFSPAARLLLEDPRLAAIADADLDAALNPLSGERARDAEQSALEDAVRMGRSRGQGAIAQLALGRSAATDAARLRALQSSQIARIDPTALLGGLSPRVDAMSGAFLSQAPGTLVTDPGQAINVGSARDVQRANVLIGQGALASQAGAARSGIVGDQILMLDLIHIKNLEYLDNNYDTRINTNSIISTRYKPRDTSWGFGATSCCELNW